MTESVNTSIPDIAVIQKELNDATTAYNDARQAESAAANRATDALNNLNEAQKRFDAAVAGIRKSAPNRSDWHGEKRSGNTSVKT